MSANKWKRVIWYLNSYKEADVMSLKPLGDRVVLKQLVAEETSIAGMVLPGQAK